MKSNSPPGAHHARAGVRDQHLCAGRAENHRPDLGDLADRVRPAVHPHRHCVHRVRCVQCHRDTVIPPGGKNLKIILFLSTSSSGLLPTIRR